MKSSSIKIATGIFGLTVIAGSIFIWFGFFNVSASDRHWDITTTFLDLVRERSIYSRSNEIMVPNLNEPEMIKNGAQNYAAMCAQCHLAPGLEVTELYQGLYPKPPVLFERNSSVHDRKSDFWIIKNGIKMTGMPAWSISHSDQQIWELVAFIFAMEEMSSENYKTLAGDGKHTHANGEHHDGEKKNLTTQNGGHDIPIVKSTPTRHNDAHDQDGHQH